MTVQKLLSHVSKLDVKLWVEDNRLQYNAPQGVMTPELKAELAKHKAEILEYLHTYIRPAVSDSSDDDETAHQEPPQILLTPSQRWLLKTFVKRPEQFSLNRCCEVNIPLDVDLMQQTLRHLIQQHDMLRAYVVFDGQEWQQFLAPPDDVSPWLFVHDFSTSAPKDWQKLIEQTVIDLQDSHNLSQPPLLRVAYIRLGPETPARLAFSLHHLIADGFSMGVIIEDFLQIYGQLSAGQAVSLPPKSTSFKVYGEELLGYTRKIAQQELDYWLHLPWDRVKPLPMDMPQGRVDDTYARKETVSLVLGYSDAQIFLRPLKDRVAMGFQLRDVLLTALVMALKEWKGLDAILVKFNHFGRNMLVEEGVDLSLTVGWIALSSNLLLELGESNQPQEALAAVKRQIHALPREGLGFDLLQWLTMDKEYADLAKPILSLPKPHLFFNLLDARPTFQENRSTAFSSPVEIFSELEDVRDDPLEIFAKKEEKSISVHFFYGPTVYHRSSMETLAALYQKNLLALIHFIEKIYDNRT